MDTTEFTSGTAGGWYAYGAGATGVFGATAAAGDWHWHAWGRNGSEHGHADSQEAATAQARAAYERLDRKP